MNIKIDSRKIVKGDIFIAIRGNNDDGHNYIESAINNGASLIICEKGSFSIPTIIVDDTKKYLEEYLKEKYYNEIKDIKLIGMTGTNGKTTTCYLIYQALNISNIKCAYIGTIGFYINGEKKVLNNTTPNIYELYEMLLECKKNNIEYVVMEVSSQGIEEGRINTLLFDYVIFSNLTQDHLDYHKTMNNYLKSKQKLFKKTRNGVAIINSDDKYYKSFLLNNKNITYGKNGDYKISDINSNITGSSFKLNNIKYETKLIGEYNIYNISVVIILLNLLNVSNIQNIISLLKFPPGRMDIIKYNSNNIIVDYAHTPDAVKKILEEINKLKQNKVITIIGCGGNRDKTKRGIMGSIACNYSDYVIFTSDNPRNEDPKKIIEDIICKLDNKNYEIKINRKKAIKRGIQLLKKNDILLLLGKGHENYQIIKNNKINFDDKEEVLKIIRR